MYVLSGKNPSPVDSAITLSAVNKIKSQPIIGSIHTNVPIYRYYVKTRIVCLGHIKYTHGRGGE